MKPLTETDIENFSPPHWGVLSSKKAVCELHSSSYLEYQLIANAIAQDVMLKEYLSLFLCTGNPRFWTVS